MRPQRVTDIQIEKAAAAVFTQQGPAASLGAIAASLGITQPGLLHRVGSKEALLVRSLCPGVPAALVLLHDGPGPGCLVAELETALTSFLGFLNEALPALSVLRFAGMDMSKIILPEGPPPPVAAREAVAGWIARCKSRINCAVPPDTAADVLVGCLEARAMSCHLERRGPSASNDVAYIRGLVTALIEEKS